MRTDAQASPVLDLRRLSVEYDAETGPVKAVLDVTLSIAPGETLALVGESGSGKSATSLAVMRLIERAGGRLAAGEALFRRPSGDVIDLAAADERTLRTIRGAEIAMISQEPMTSLNPVFTASRSPKRSGSTGACRPRTRPAKRSRFWSACAFPTPRASRAVTRTNSRAGCVSAS